MPMAHRWISGAVLMGLLAPPLFGGSVDDDLAVVKKAVGPDAQPAPRSETRPAREPGKDEPRWLKLRITDRGDKKAKVSLNLPLDLVRALDDGDDAERLFSPHHKNGKSVSIRLSDVLRALRSGQEIVEIEDEEATVRIWVE
jgi:hypothetical protein